MGPGDNGTPIAPPRAGADRAAGAEPLAGYRLIEPLGSGGFGEVWKCEVPGGLYKAIKFVEGGGHGAAEPGSPAARELEALQQIKAIRHPFLLSIERVEVIDGRLVIVMELADKNLQNLLLECQESGLPGIPRDELLGYLAEGAEALDVLNLQHGLQHLDVKPHNLFVVSNHIKVGDFGLVHGLPAAGTNGQHKGGVGTPLYAAPEILQNSMSRHSDQYSLAIVYQQLLTGTVPFWSPQAYHLVMQHLTGKPNLTALPASDQPAVARALAKDPEQRYPSCLDFVQALVHAQGGSATVGSGLWRRPSGLRQAVKSPSDRLSASGTPSSERSVTPPEGSGGPTGNHRAHLTQSGRPISYDQPTRIMATMEVPAGYPALTGRGHPPGLVTSLALPGFRFLTCIGQSPLVDLWTVQDPEGKERMAHCVLNHSGADEAALERLRGLQHPALPPREIFASPGSRAILVSDLGKKTLRDACEEFQTQGQAGIPRRQLLAYLRAAAQALDQFQTQEGLLHLGLNPGNLLVQDDRLWIGDFGLIPVFWLPAGHSAAQLNPRYAAPELYTTLTSATADQYSLAIIFTEMLTGIYPRTKSATKSGTWRRPSIPDSRQGQHRRPESHVYKPASRAGKIDLDLLPADDRQAIARALSDDPAQRFPSCTALIDALEATTIQPAVENTDLYANLPLVVAYASLLGQPVRPGTVVPTLESLVHRLVAGATGAVNVLTFDSARYLLNPDGSWEYRCPIQLFSGLAKLKLEGFGQHWSARLTHSDQTDYTFRITTGQPEARRFWQRGSPGQAAGVEVQIRLVPAADAVSQLYEAVVRVRALGCDREIAAGQMRELAPRLFQSVRAYLQGRREQRQAERWPFDQRLHVYPVRPDLELAGVMEGRGRDLSRGGLRILVNERPPSEFVYLHFRETPYLAQHALLTRIIRVQECDDGVCELGVTFSVDAPQVVEETSEVFWQR